VRSIAALADQRQQQRGDVAGSAREVQHRVPCAHPAGGREPALPQAVDAERHQIVHQVVARRDRGEHAADELFFLADRHVAETEMRGVFVHAAMVTRLGCPQSATAGPTATPLCPEQFRNRGRGRAGIHFAFAGGPDDSTRKAKPGWIPRSRE
jgi:hypothetical protein